MIDQPHVVDRLKRRINDARSLGFKVRMEALDGQQATWCEIAGVPTLFVDLSQTAAEQLQQVDEALVAYQPQRFTPHSNEPLGARSMRPEVGQSIHATPLDRAA